MTRDFHSASFYHEHKQTWRTMGGGKAWPNYLSNLLQVSALVDRQYFLATSWSVLCANCTECRFNLSFFISGTYKPFIYWSQFSFRQSCYLLCQCSSTCRGGTKKRGLVCKRRNDRGELVKVPEILCHHAPKPSPTTMDCNTNVPCPSKIFSFFYE